MTPKREKELREGVGIWAEGGQALAIECLDAVTAQRDALAGAAKREGEALRQMNRAVKLMEEWERSAWEMGQRAEAAEAEVADLRKAAEATEVDMKRLRDPTCSYCKGAGISGSFRCSGCGRYERPAAPKPKAL